jgi:hypothetical protein
MARTKRGRERRRSKSATASPAAPTTTSVSVPRAHQGRQAAAAARKAGPGPLARTGATIAAIRAVLTARPAATLVGLAMMVAAFTLYLITAARDITFGDTPELTAVALTGGVAHAPGYPLFTVIGWVFGQLPVGPLPFRIALFSVVCHTLTVGVIYAGTFRFTRSIPAAAVAAAVLAFAPLFWYWSLVGEVFPLNDLFAATMLLLVALWHEHPERRALFVAGGLVGGLGMADQQTILLLGPAVLYVMWLRRKVLLRDLTLVRNAAIAFAAGLLPYLVLIPLAGRDPFFSWGDIRGPGDLVSHVLRTDYGTTSLIADPKFAGGSLIARVGQLFIEMDPLFLAMVIVGAIFAWRVRRWYATYLLIAFGVAGPAFIAYSNAKIDDPTVQAVLGRFFLMPYVAVAPLVGFAVLAAGELAGRLRLSRRVLETALAAVTLSAAIAIVVLNYRDIDQSTNHVARTFGEDLLATMRPNAIFFGGGDPIVFSVAYLQAVEHARPDITLVESPLLGAKWYVRQLKRLHPELVIQDDQYGGTTAPVKHLFDANRTRPLMAVGDLPDGSTTGFYYFASHGLLYDVHPIAEIVTLDSMAADNEQVLAGYHPSRYADLTGPFRTWERLSLVDYSLAYYRVGHEYQVAADGLKDKNAAQATQLYASAKQWFERALAVLPTLAEALDGLKKLPK